jgi:hypothetical protein
LWDKSHHTHNKHHKHADNYIHHQHGNYKPHLHNKLPKGIIKDFTNSINDMVYHYFKYESEFKPDNVVNNNGFRPWLTNSNNKYEPY